MKLKSNQATERPVEIKLENGKNKTSVFKCQCGADMVYSISKKTLYCPYCDNTKGIAQTYSSKRNYEIEKDGGTVDASVKLYECPNCGGQLELDQFEMVKKCPFCGATNCLPVEDFSGLKPDSILPFEIDKDDALEHGKKWIKKKFFAPSKLKNEFNVDNFKGMYVPAFSFDTFTTSRYDGRLGYKRTRTVMKNGERTEETYIEWHSVSGTYDENFVDKIIEATTQLTQKEMKGILPYDMENVVGYKREYIAGFLSERYDTPLDDSFSLLKIEIEKSIRQSIKEEYDADEIDYLNVYTDYLDTKFRYAMLPIWLCKYAYKEKDYRYIVNGRTGKAYGKIPRSPIKIAICALLAVAVAVGLIIYALINSGTI